MRLIDADALIDEIDEEIEYGTEKYEEHFDDADKYITKGLRIARKDTLKQPTIDAALIKHGQWEWEPGYVGTQARCSVCKRSPIGFYSLPILQIGRLPEYPFCPKCGARMDGGVEDETD